MIDMHSHILPGLDDGAPDWEQSLAMAKMAVEDGITSMVCTPHWVLGKYENGRTAILEKVAEFKERLAAAEIPLAVYPGSELRLDMSIPDRLRTGEIIGLNDRSGYVLLELPEENLPDSLEDFFWNLQIAGLRPIISHVERNPVLRARPRRLFNWVEAGILTQITAASILEQFSMEIMEFSHTLIRHRLVHMLVTDTHGLRMRIPRLSEARAVVEGLAGPAFAELLVSGTPQRIIRGESVPVIDPLPLEAPGKKKARFWSLFSR